MVGLAAAEHVEDGAQEVVGQCDDGPFVAAANQQRLELGLEDGLGTAGGMGELAEQAVDVGVALADPTGLTFAGGLVVAGADADPGGHAVGGAKGRHVRADFHQQHGCPNAIDPGQGLQQGEQICLAFQAGEEPRIEAGNAGLAALDVVEQLLEHESKTFDQVPLQGIEDAVATGLEPPAGKLEHLRRRHSSDDRFDHGPRRQAVQVADHDAEPNPTVGQYLVQAILLGRQETDALLPLPRNQPQFHGARQGSCRLSHAVSC